MTNTITASFTVTDIANNDVFLKKRDSSLHVVVEGTGVDYPNTIRRKLNTLTPESIIDATLTSINETNTAWKFESLTVTNTPLN